MKTLAPTLVALCVALAAAAAQAEPAPEDLRDVLLLSEGEIVRGQLDKYENEDFYFDSDDLGDPPRGPDPARFLIDRRATYRTCRKRPLKFLCAALEGRRDISGERCGQ